LLAAERIAPVKLAAVAIYDDAIAVIAHRLSTT
jgi:hypothetical protein